MKYNIMLFCAIKIAVMIVMIVSNKNLKSIRLPVKIIKLAIMLYGLIYDFFFLTIIRISLCLTIMQNIIYFWNRILCGVKIVQGN